MLFFVISSYFYVGLLLHVITLALKKKDMLVLSVPLGGLNIVQRFEPVFFFAV